MGQAGLIVVDSPHDPKPSLRLVNGRVEEMDGKQRADFDALDLFIADHSLDLEAATEAMSTDSRQLAHMLVDINVPAATMRRSPVAAPRPSSGHRPHMNVLEMMMGAGEDARPPHAGQPGACDQLARAPGPAGGRCGRGGAARLRRGRDDRAVARNAPFNALAILVGTQTGAAAC